MYLYKTQYIHMNGFLLVTGSGTFYLPVVDTATVCVVLNVFWLNIPRAVERLQRWYFVCFLSGLVFSMLSTLIDTDLGCES